MRARESERRREGICGRDAEVDGGGDGSRRSNIQRNVPGG